MNIYKILIFFFICNIIFSNASAQFKGTTGVYYLGTANVPINTFTYSNPNLSGVVIRFKWNDLEPNPGKFDWKFIDNEIIKAKLYNKKVSLQPLSYPDWMKKINVQQYYYIDKNTYHSTYGKILSSIIPWDSLYINRYKILLDSLAGKYATNTSVSYINTIGGAFSRGLPDSVIVDTLLLTRKAFWKAFNYNADSMGVLMNSMTDYYMSLFPTTPLWCSVDYVSFQPNASGQARNYLASLYCSYGITHYPDRFGLWREDISACNPGIINPTNQWYIMQQNPCRIGAQMLWSVQDGPVRMNQCGIIPNSKTSVLDSAVNKAINMGMRYLEIYGVDINDETLANSIHDANTKLISGLSQCNSQQVFSYKYQEHLFNIKPNPTHGCFTISFLEKNEFIEIIITNLTGQIIKELEVTNNSTIDISGIEKGIYFIHDKNLLYKSSRIIIQ